MFIIFIRLDREYCW